MDLLISGASKGIGRALVEAAADEGHRVLALARSEEELQRLSASHSRVHALPLDLSDTRLEERTREFLEREGVEKLDGVINAAGYLEQKPFQKLSTDDWEKVMQVNLIGPSRLLRSSYPYLKEGNDPHVILIGSMAGYPGSQKFAGMSAYGASKAGLAALGECLAEEWSEAGIRINTLALGAVDTEMFREAFPGRTAPLAPDEMASFILDFLQRGGRVMNGKHLPISLSTP
jgi:NAD(P)-dependent dehydrogenase (short-subunit alcohol dehydrogenase family)